jgi:hypothetical protein
MNTPRFRTNVKNIFNDDTTDELLLSVRVSEAASLHKGISLSYQKGDSQMHDDKITFGNNGEHRITFDKLGYNLCLSLSDFGTSHLLKASAEKLLSDTNGDSYPLTNDMQAKLTTNLNYNLASITRKDNNLMLIIKFTEITTETVSAIEKALACSTLDVLEHLAPRF